MSQSNCHETQSPREQLSDDPYVDPQLAPMQRIESGGPRRRVNLQQMPKWLRVFGYFFYGFLLVEALFGLYASLTH